MSEDGTRIRTEVIDGNILLIRINRPEARNAFDGAAAREMEAALDRLDATPELFAGIIYGEGGNFSAGADLKAIARGEACGTERRGGFGIFKKSSNKPLFAAVEGFAVGGGMELCLACDLVIAAQTARFGLPEVRHNTVAIGGGVLRLQRRIPHHIAMEMALTGEPREAAFLERWGLVNRLCPEGTALETALEWARKILRGGPMALSATKEIISASPYWGEQESWDKQAEIMQRVLESEDLKEGLAAFAEKRKPVWRGR